MRNRPNGPVFLIINTKYTFAAMVLQNQKPEEVIFRTFCIHFYFAAK